MLTGQSSARGRVPEAGPPDATPDRDIADLVDESVIVFRLDMRVTAWNAEAERLYGWSRDEVIGSVIQDAVHCSPSDPLPAIRAKAFAAGLWQGEFTRTTKSGGLVAVRAKWVLRRNAAGDPLDFVETSRDITSVRRTEEAFDRVQDQYRNLFQASVASFLELDFSETENLARALLQSGVADLRAFFRANPDAVRQMIHATRVADVNAQCLAMLGNGDRDELLRSLNALWPDESLGLFAECVIGAVENSAHYAAEAVFTTLDGRRLDTLFTVSYPGRMLNAARVLVGIADITQAKAAKAAQEKSERRYRDLFHLLPVPLMQIDSREIVAFLENIRSQGVTDLKAYLIQHPDVTGKLLDSVKIIEVNRRTVSMLRARSAAELTGPVRPYWTESPEIFREVMAARYAGMSGYEAMMKMPARDGSILDVLFFQTFASITGEQHFSVVQLIDVSDRVKAQDKLAHVQAEIAHAARVSLLGELTASIAHEVSQPLTAIATNTEASLLWLARSPPDIAEVRELSARTAIEVQRAADIIHRIRSMALHGAPEQTRLQLNPLMEEAILFLRHELQRNGVATSLRLGANLPDIFGDRVQLQQVIVNLAINAIQAMAQAGSAERQLTIITAATYDDPGKHSISIDVEDTGPGIAELALGRLFESFFTTKATGIGIGLPICRSIIEAHGGEIRAENRADRLGARFRLRLPSRPRAEIK